MGLQLTFNIVLALFSHIDSEDERRAFLASLPR